MLFDWVRFRLLAYLRGALQHLLHRLPLPSYSNTHPQPVHEYSTPTLTPPDLVEVLLDQVREADIPDDSVERVRAAMEPWESLGSRPLATFLDEDRYTHPAVILQLPPLNGGDQEIDVEALLGELQVATRDGCSEHCMAIRHDVLYSKHPGIFLSSRPIGEMKFGSLFELRKAG